MLKRFLTGASLALAMATPAAAESVALMFGNTDYRNIDDAGLAVVPFAAIDQLQRVGISVDAVRDADQQAVWEHMGQFSQMLRASDRQVIVLSGRFANDGVETFFLPVDMPRPNLVNLYRYGIPLGLFMSALEKAQDNGLLLLAPADVVGSTGAYWSWGLAPIDPPAGVHVVRGTPGGIRFLLNSSLPVKNRNLIDDINRSDELSVIGAPPVGPFLPRDNSAALDLLADELTWRSVGSVDTVEAYQAYLRRFPAGLHAAEARTRIDALTAPVPEEVEAALHLTRNERRDIQRDLSVLGYNTRGIDGIFGPGTRGAIKGWQDHEGFDPTSYLTAEQVDLLDRQGAARAAELQRQAEERARQQRAADIAYWVQNGQDGSEAGLRRYLAHYPDGVRSELAKSLLADIEAERNRAQQALADRRAWDRARSRDSVDSYRDYLRAFPNGRFEAQARARLDQLLNEQRSDLAADLRAWQRAQSDDTVPGYRLYLEDFPQGRFKRQADARIAQLIDARNNTVADRDAWQQARATDTVPAYRAYIAAFPQGRFVGAAQQRIDELRAARGSAADRNAWQQAEQANTLEAYQSYLADFPNGRFAAEARQRVDQLEAEARRQQQIESWKAEERAMNLTSISRLLIEQRLKRLGLNPGTVDGNFNRATRNAIRDYQDQAGLPVTGFMNQATMVRLLADGVRQIIDQSGN